MIVNSAELTFVSRSVNERFARMSVAAFASQLDPTVEELAEIKTAVSEAVTNCIVHAYGSDLGAVRMKMQLFDDNTLRVTVRDFGCGIENVGQAMEPCFSTGSDDRAGMGFTIMESFSDRLRVSSKPGKGTKVVMDRKIVKRG
ncbi:MAG: anti-sigma F factor [Eubacteriales bacterium]|nr:anti-sigma F factor [Clostridiales bacterium]MDD6342166.1 anti-sigma F factor [Eubacteriales bacterium]MDD7393530.1 anti-sigma F factor [Eubacteriales bacterium]MDY3759958.1 anti-sigma F factor [Eubacteriales bacterium]